MEEELKKATVLDDSILDIIHGRIDPHIYAFSTGTIPNYLKVGDTYRPVWQRLKEWESVYPELHQEFEDTARLDEDHYFRDYSIHRYLVETLGRERLTRDVYPNEYFSNEFFRDATPEEVARAISVIREDYQGNGDGFAYYSLEVDSGSSKRIPKSFHFTRDKDWKPRENQAKVISRFMQAKKAGRTNLLMYAVMRFGKSFTALCCAKKMKAKLVIIVSAKAQVSDEWKENVERPLCFEGFQFFTASDLGSGRTVIKDAIQASNTAVVFLTLQDLNGKNIKAKHIELFGQKADLLIVDETHFGARAESYGAVIRKDRKEKTDEDVSGTKRIQEVDEIKKIIAKITLHLSGTPYRILMSNEFEPQDIIATVQYSDIIEEQRKWSRDVLNLERDDFENPMYGFPEMIRFAFDLNKSSRALLDEMAERGVEYGLSDLFKPKSIDKSGDYQHFHHEPEVLSFLKAIDGSAAGENVFGFLDNDRIKKGEMCRHMVFVLPYCASCDSMARLIQDHSSEFINLKDYVLLNISGIDQTFPDVASVKNRIRELEREGKKTITLTVNRMLTGSTVREWDTMVFLKDSSSPQEYDQAIYRIQSPYVVRHVLKADDSNNPDHVERVIKVDKKPQTLLIDFDPARLFKMEEVKALVYNADGKAKTMEEVRQRIEQNLAISPIIVLNAAKLEKVQAVNLLDYITRYAETRGIMEEAGSLPVDLSVARLPLIKEMLSCQVPIGGKGGFDAPATQGKEDTELERPQGQEGSTKPETIPSEQITQTTSEKEDASAKTRRQFQRYWARILSFAYLTDDVVETLQEIIDAISRSKDNKRIAYHVGISRDILKSLIKHMNRSVLYILESNIRNMNKLSHDGGTEEERMAKAKLAINKFNSFGPAEIPTPSSVCQNMLDSLSINRLCEIIDQGGHILDMASKTGEFAMTIASAYLARGGDKEKLRKAIYSIPVSLMTYEFVRKAYELVGLDIDCIAHFTSLDMAYRPLDPNDDENSLMLTKKKIEEPKTFSRIIWDRKSKEDFEGANARV